MRNMQFSRLTALIALCLLGFVAAAQAEEMMIPIQSLSTFRKDVNSPTARAAVAVPTIPSGDSIHIDYAELIFPIFAEVDSMDPLLIMVAPITRQWTPGTISWNNGWTKPGGDFNPEIGGLRAVFASATEKEIRIDVTAIVIQWQKGKLPNFGLMVKSHTEGNSALSFIRDGRYSGADAKLRILYCRP